MKWWPYILGGTVLAAVGVAVWKYSDPLDRLKFSDAAQWSGDAGDVVFIVANEEQYSWPWTLDGEVKRWLVKNPGAVIVVTRKVEMPSGVYSSIVQNRQARPYPGSVAPFETLEEMHDALRTKGKQ